MFQNPMQVYSRDSAQLVSDLRNDKCDGGGGGGGGRELERLTD